YYVFAKGASLSLGHLYDASGHHQDFEFDFLLHEGDETLAGIVVYQIPGDFNGDGAVNAADYAVWRTGLATLYTSGDYNDWRTHFGLSLAGSFGGSSAGFSANTAVPEPKNLALLFFAAATVLYPVQQRRQTKLGN